MKQTDRITIKWAQSREEIKSVIKLFIESVGTDYISHGEVISGRAIDFTQWSPKLEEILTNELSKCINPDTKNHYLLAICEKDHKILGFAFYDIIENGTNKIATLNDLLVSPQIQGQGLGLKIIIWAENELKIKNVNHVLLESGIQNKSAHRFFEKQGFEICSITMNKKLG